MISYFGIDGLLMKQLLVEWQPDLWWQTGGLPGLSNDHHHGDSQS